MSKSKNDKNKSNRDYYEDSYGESEDGKKRRKSGTEILNSYYTGEYEEEDFYYEEREKFRSNGRKRNH